jgi:hypothetical protein
MKKHLPALGLALLLTCLLALIISGTIGDAVVLPLLLLAWFAQVLYQSIHQGLLWGIFVLIAMLLLATSFPWSSAPLPAINPQAAAQGRLADWSRWIAAAKRDDYSRWRLAQRLTQLAIDTLAFREQCSTQEITRRLNNGSLDIPPQLRAYLYAGNMSYTPKFRQRRRFGRPAQDPPRADPLALDPQLVIEYLEHTLQHTIGAA